MSGCSSSGGKTKTRSSFVADSVCGLGKALTLSGPQTFYCKKKESEWVMLHPPRWVCSAPLGPLPSSARARSPWRERAPHPPLHPHGSLNPFCSTKPKYLLIENPVLVQGKLVMVFPHLDFDSWGLACPRPRGCQWSHQGWKPQPLRPLAYLVPLPPAPAEAQISHDL